MEQEISKQTIVTIIISLVMITLIVLILMITLRAFGGVDSFKSSCESFGGYFWEIANVTCSVGAPNCRYMCALNDERFSMSDLGDFGLFSYSKQICVKDCAYENKQAKENDKGEIYRCVC